MVVRYDYKCPHCGEVFTTDERKQCPNCGYKVDEKGDDK